MANKNLHLAKEKKNDEFYTQLSDIEKELRYYKDQLKGKTIFCNCDDPVFSNFFVYFYNNFKLLGLKKLIATHFEYGNKQSYKLEIIGEDLNKDGKTLDVADLQKLIEDFKNNPKLYNDYNLFSDRLKKADIGLELLAEDGDFRSDECIKLLKEADIVVTNPPFSLFREYMTQLMEYNKNFLIIGNDNAITYKDIFTLIKQNKVWMGYTRAKEFMQPDGSLKKFGNIGRWTNLDVSKRHEELVLYKQYNPAEYLKYDNYDAINIDKVTDIPLDYNGAMGVPITFIDKYNPDQFEIIGLGISNSGIEIGVRPYKKEHKKYRKEVQNRGAVDGDLYMMINGIVTVPYARVLIKKK